MTGTLLWRLVMLHLNTWGNAYLGKKFAGGQVVELWPIRPDRVRVARTNGVKQFFLRDAYGRELPTRTPRARSSTSRGSRSTA
jgi:phage portal protein BeeE